MAFHSSVIERRLLDWGEERIALMDETGLDMQVLSLTTPDLPAGISGNTLTMTLGGIALTELDALAVPVTAEPPTAQQPPATGSPGTTVTTVVPGTPGVPGTLPPPAGQAPQVAPGQSVAFEVRGRRISDRTALVAFAGWQLLSLGTATLYGFVERRRRLVLLGRAP